MYLIYSMLKGNGSQQSEVCLGLACVCDRSAPILVLTRFTVEATCTVGRSQPTCNCGLNTSRLRLNGGESASVCTETHGGLHSAQSLCAAFIPMFRQRNRPSSNARHDNPVLLPICYTSSKFLLHLIHPVPNQCCTPTNRCETRLLINRIEQAIEPDNDAQLYVARLPRIALHLHGRTPLFAHTYARSRARWRH